MLTAIFIVTLLNLLFTLACVFTPEKVRKVQEVIHTNKEKENYVQPKQEDWA